MINPARRTRPDSESFIRSGAAINPAAVATYRGGGRIYLAAGLKDVMGSA
jgi:hypothetical protein